MNLLLGTKLLALSGVLALGGLIGIAPAAHASAQGPIAQSVLRQPTTSGQSTTQPATEPRLTTIPSALPQPTLLVGIDTSAADSPLVWGISGQNFPPDQALVVFGYICGDVGQPELASGCDTSTLFRVGQSAIVGSSTSGQSAIVGSTTSGQSSPCGVGGCPQEFVGVTVQTTTAAAPSGAGFFATDVDLVTQGLGVGGLTCGYPVFVSVGIIGQGSLATVETPLCGGPEGSGGVPCPPDPLNPANCGPALGLLSAPAPAGLTPTGNGTGAATTPRTSTGTSTGGAGGFSGSGGFAPPRVHAAE